MSAALGGITLVLVPRIVEQPGFASLGRSWGGVGKVSIRVVPDTAVLDGSFILLVGLDAMGWKGVARLDRCPSLSARRGADVANCLSSGGRHGRRRRMHVGEIAL